MIYGFFCPFLSFFLIFNLFDDLSCFLLHVLNLFHSLVININVKPNILLVFVILPQVLPLCCVVHDKSFSCLLAFQIHSCHICLIVFHWENQNLKYFWGHLSETFNQLVFELFLRESLRLPQAACEERNIGVVFSIVEVENSLSLILFQKSYSDFLKVANGCFEAPEFDQCLNRSHYFLFIKVFRVRNVLSFHNDSRWLKIIFVDVRHNQLLCSFLCRIFNLSFFFFWLSVIKVWNVDCAFQSLIRNIRTNFNTNL